MTNIFDVKNSKTVALTKKIIKEKDTRDRTVLYVSTAVNYFFVLFQLYGGIHYRSMWFTALGVYYAALTSVRLYIGLSNKGRGREAWKVFRVSGWALILANLALAVMISVMVAVPAVATYGYSPAMAVGVTVWTFYLVISAVVEIVRQWKKQNPIALAENAVQLIGAVVSVLMLQTAMIASYSTQVTERARAALAQVGEVVALDEISLLADDLIETFVVSNRITGILVLVAVIAITIYMIVKGNVEYKKAKK